MDDSNKQPGTQHGTLIDIHLIQEKNRITRYNYHYLQLMSVVSESSGRTRVASPAIYSVMFNLLISLFTTLLQIFFDLPTGLLPSTSSSIALLSMLI